LNSIPFYEGGREFSNVKERLQDVNRYRVLLDVCGWQIKINKITKQKWLPVAKLFMV
jgi:hypothetical protein